MNTLEARIAGEDAYYAGKTLSANPFDRFDDNYDSWEDGFNQAYGQDRFLFNEQDHPDYPA